MAIKQNQAKTQSIRVLSVQQPHADEILFGDKWCENRTWDTVYRGTLYIHSSQKWDGPRCETPGDGVTGAILGHVELIDVLPMQVLRKLKLTKAKPDEHAEIWKFLQKQSKESWQHVCGDFCWMVTNPVALEKPITVKGSLGIWKFEMAE